MILVWVIGIFLAWLAVNIAARVICAAIAIAYGLDRYQ